MASNYFDLESASDEDFAARYGDEAPAQAVTASPIEMPDQAFMQRYSEDPAVANKPENIWDSAAPTLQYWSNKLQNGSVDVARNQAGLRVLQGKASYDQIKTDVDRDKLKQMRDADIAQFEKENFGRWTIDLFGQDFDTDWRMWAGRALESVPFMAEVFKGGAVGGVAGAAVGAGGAAALGQLGPQIGLPEEIITVPAATAKGFQWGWRSGAFKTSSELMSGGAYLDLLERGFKPETARPVAIGVGAVSGLVETLQLGQLTALGRKAALDQLTSEAGKATLKGWIADYAKNVGYEVAEEELQQIADLSGRGIAAVMDKNPGKAPTAEQIQQELLQTFIQATQASIVLGGATAVGGSAAGKTADLSLDAIAATAKRGDQMREAIGQANLAARGAEAIRGMADKVAQGKANLADVFQFIAEGLEKGGPTQEDIQAASQMSVEQTLTDVLTPLVDEAGKVINTPEGAQIVAGITEAVVQELSATEGGPTMEQIAAAEGGTAQAAADVEAAQPTGPAPVPMDSLPEPLSLEVQGRIRVVSENLQTVDAEIDDLEAQFEERETANTKAAEIDARIAELKNQQKANAAQIAQLNKDIKAKEKAGKSTENIWKTLDKIGVQQEAVVDQLQRLQAERESLPVGATAALVSKLDKAYNRRAELEGDLELLRGGAYQEADLKNLDIKVKAGRVLALRAQAAKEAIRQFKQGAKATMDEVKAVQKQLVSLIRSSDLDPQDQGKFLVALRDVRTAAQLEKVLPDIQRRIDALIEADAKRTAKANLKKVLKQAGLRKTGNYAQGKYTAETQDMLDRYIKFDADKTARQAAIDAFAAAIESGAELTDDMLLDNAAAQAVDTEGKTAAEVQATVDEIKAIIEGGKQSLAEVLAERREADAQRVAAAVKSIQGNKPYNPKERADSLVNALRRFGRKFWAETETWKGLMELASQHDPDHKIAEVLDPAVSREQYFAIKDRWEKRIADKLAGISKQFRKRFGPNAARRLGQKLTADLKKNPKGIGDYIDANGNRQTLFYSQSEVRKLWMEFQAAKVDENIRASLKEGNGFTFIGDVKKTATEMSTEQLVNEAMSQEDIMLAEAQLKIYDEIYNELLNPYWRKRFGTNLPRVAMYSPILREGFDIEDDATLLQHFVVTGGIKPSSSMKRTGSLKPLAAQDDISTLTRHLDKIVRFVTYDEFDRSSKVVLNNGDVRTLIKNKYGSAVLSLVTQHRRDITTGQAIFNDIAWQMIDDWRRKVATAYIGGKLAAVPKQATAMFTALDRVGPVGFTKALLKVGLNPVGTFKQLNKSATFRRIVSASDRDTMEVLSLAKRPFLNDYAAGLIDWLMLPVRVGVGVGAGVSGKAVLDKALAEGKSESEALAEMNAFLTDTQQAGFIENQSAMERTGALGKVLTMFGGDPLQSARQIIRAGRDFVKDPLSPSAAAQALRKYAIFHLTVPMSFFLVSEMIDAGDDDDEYFTNRFWRVAVFGPWLQVPILGDTLNYALINMQNALEGGKERAFAPSSPLLASLKAFGDFMRSAAKAYSEDDAEAEAKALYNLGKASPLAPRALGGGLPWPELVNWFVPKPEENSTEYID